MKVPFFSLQSSAADIASVKRTLAGGWLTTGERTAELETLVKERCNAKYAVAVSSATAGLKLALAALEIGAGDEVITTAFTFTATCAAIVQSGARPVIADIDPITLNLDPQTVAQKVTKRTRAIIAVDIAGLPCDYSALLALCRKHKLKLICDAAHSFGAAIKISSKRTVEIGAIGAVNVFSFYSTKNLTTAEGGMVLTKNRNITERIRRLSLHGITKSALQRNKAADWRYDISEIGFKANLSDFNAALGVSRMQRFESLLASRQRIAKWYLDELRRFEELIELPPQLENTRQAWHLFIVKLNLERWKIGRDRFIKELTQLGIGCGVHYIPLHYFSAYKNILRIRAHELYHTEKSYARVVSLPLYPELKRSEVKAACDAVGELVRRYGK
jgi:dTDP-4-amino-4,6-dideoxygalactose transaminase